MNAELNRSDIFKTAAWTAWLCVGGTLLQFTATSLAAPARAPAPAPSASVAEVIIPKSVFVDRPDFGRDPFFPKSERRGKVMPATTTTVQPVANFDSVALKGISVNNERRTAIINNKTFEAGEEGNIPVNGQPVKIKCTEIR